MFETNNAEIRQQLLDKQIDNMQKAYNQYALMTDVIQSFDNKVVNKRLENYLNNALTMPVTVNNSGYAFIITAQFRDRVVMGERCAYYIPTDARQLVYMPKNKTQPIINRNRLNAEAVLDNMTAMQVGLMQEMIDLARASDMVDTWRKEIEKIKQRVEELNHQMPYEIQQIYDLNIRVAR